MFVDGVVRPLGHVPNSNRTVCWDFVFAIALCVEFDMSTVGRFGQGDPTSGQTTALLWNKVQTADFCYLQKKKSDKWRTHVPLRWQNGKIAVALWFWTELFNVDISWIFLTWTLWICGKPFLAVLGTLRLTRCCSLRRWGLRGAGGQGQVRTGWNRVFDLRFFFEFGVDWQYELMAKIKVLRVAVPSAKLWETVFSKLQLLLVLLVYCLICLPDFQRCYLVATFQTIEHILFVHVWWGKHLCWTCKQIQLYNVNWSGLSVAFVRHSENCQKMISKPVA